MHKNKDRLRENDCEQQQTDRELNCGAASKYCHHTPNEESVAAFWLFLKFVDNNENPQSWQSTKSTLRKH